MVLMDHSLLPEGRVSKSLLPGWEGPATILLARLRALEPEPVLGIGSIGKS